ncbi:unnamed protein product [Closterium sp. Naga37s-1]|nr:unnamed protein product [Closterium sp. Naga37s-1]
MEVENEPIAAAAGCSVPTASSEQSVTIPEPFKGWTAKAVKDFRFDLKNYLKAKSKLKKMKTLDSQVAKDKFRKIKVQCIEKARSEIATAKDDIKVQELLRQKSREAEELKKSAAAEEMTGMETGPTIDEIVRQQVQKAKAEIRKEVKAEFEATLSAKLKAFSLVKQDASMAPAAANSKPKRAKKKRGGKNKKKANTPTNSKEKGPETTPSTSKKAWVPKNGGGGPAKGPLKKK